MTELCKDLALAVNESVYFYLFIIGHTEAAWVCAVHSIKKNDGSTFYIADRSHSVSSCEGYEWLDAYMINGDSLKVVSVYDGGDDLDDCHRRFCHF